VNSSTKRHSRRDQAVARVAAGQHGVVTLAQLRAAGLADGDIKYRVAGGRLHRVRRGVYAVGHACVSREGGFLAAALSIGEGAVVSHTSAALLWGVLDERPGPTHITVARQVRSRRGIRVHSVRRLPRGDTAKISGVPVTTLPRTLLDLADVAAERTLRRAVRQAAVQHQVDECALRDQLQRAQGRHGAPRLGALIADGPAPTRSELEDRTLDLLRVHNFPRPAVNATLAGLARRVEVDFLFAEHGLIVEADGARYHDNRIARQDDTARQAMLEAAGYRVVRVTWAQVTRDTAQTVRRLRRAFGA
jgi:predicted transcriptional regulator of viral defense system